MISNPLVSVVIPVFNTGELLVKCIESVESQTYPNIEIIIIDDGSTDNSRLIIEQFEHDSERTVYSSYQTNSGQASARNAAIEMVNGKYVMFLDSDDWLAPETIDTLFNAIADNNADIAMCDFETVNEFGNVTGQYSSGELGGDKVLIESRPEIAFELVPQVTGKLFDIKLFTSKKIRFPEGIWYEDLALLPVIIFSANKLVKVNGYFYKYFKREGSTTMSVSLKVLDAMKAIAFIRDNLSDRPLNNRADNAFTSLITRTVYITAVRLSELTDSNERKLGFKELRLFLLSSLSFSQLMASQRPFTEKLITLLLYVKCGEVIPFLKKIKNS